MGVWVLWVGLGGWEGGRVQEGGNRGISFYLGEEEFTWWERLWSGRSAEDTLLPLSMGTEWDLGGPSGLGSSGSSTGAAKGESSFPWTAEEMLEEEDTRLVPREEGPAC